MYPNNNINDNGLNQDNLNIQQNGINNIPLQDNQVNQDGVVNNNYFSQGQINNTMYDNNPIVQNNTNNNQNNMQEKNKGNKKILLIVFLLVLITAIIVVIVFVIGNKGEDKNTNNGNVDNNLSGDKNNNNSDYDQEWGVEGLVTASNAEGIFGYYICYPEQLGTAQGTGWIAPQPDGTTVFADGQNQFSSVAINSVSELFPAYFDQAAGVLEGFYRMDIEDISFQLENQEEVEINGYQMVKFTGILSYLYEGEPVECNWASYATTLKNGGAYVYWMVLDAYDAKKVTSDIEATALKMAQSLREEE